MTEISFEGRLDWLMKIIKSIEEDMTKPNDDWMAVMVMMKEGNMTIMPLFFDSEEEKEIMATIAMPAAIRIFEPDFVAQVQSAWMVVGDTTKGDDPYKTRPSKHPKRKEIVILMGMTIEQTQFWHAEIKRSKNAPPTLSEWELWPTDAFTTGMFIDPIREALLSVEEER